MTCFCNAAVLIHVGQCVLQEEGQASRLNSEVSKRLVGVSATLLR